METKRTGKRTLIFAGLLVSFVIIFAFVPRCEFGESNVHNMTHWISFSDVTTPVTVKMLINAESRPYLRLLNATYNPTPADISTIRINFHPGDAGQEAIQVTWIITEPTTVYANFQIATYETRYVTPVIGFETSKPEELGSTQFYPVENQAVQGVANKILGNMGGWSRSNTDKAKAVFNWMKANIQYDMKMVGVHSPVEVLNQRKAVCEGLAYTFATLSRALGVPARVFYGNLAAVSPEYEFSGIFWQKHAWAEFWDGSNWQPVDPTNGNFGSLNTGPYVQTSFGLWSIEVSSEKGIIWPVNKDSRVTVSGCGLDWARFVKYGTTPWVFIWMVTNSWAAGAFFTIIGGVYLGKRQIHPTNKPRTFNRRTTQTSIALRQNLEDNHPISSDDRRPGHRINTLLAYQVGRR